jgi:hypothetical protein
LGYFDGEDLPHIIEMGEGEAEARVPYLKRLLSST